MSDRPPINKENVERLQTWAVSASEQARRALAKNGPEIAATMETMARSLQAAGSKAAEGLEMMRQATGKRGDER